MTVYKKSVRILFLAMLALAILLSGCAETPPSGDSTVPPKTDTTPPPSIDTEIVGTWQITAVWVHGDSKQEYVSEIFLIFKSDNTVELSDNNHEEPLVYSGTYYIENDKIYTDYTSANQESFEVSFENMNGEITIDGETGELVYDYINDSNGLTWYFVKK